MRNIGNRLLIMTNGFCRIAILLAAICHIPCQAITHSEGGLPWWSWLIYPLAMLVIAIEQEEYSKTKKS